MSTKLQHATPPLVEHWIPVTEMLPDAGDEGESARVLVSFEPTEELLACNEHAKPGVMIDRYNHNSYEWYGVRGRDLLITAWAPLPAPYECPPAVVTPEEIIATVSEWTRVPVDLIKGGELHHAAVAARRLCVALIRHLTGAKYYAVAQEVGMSAAGSAQNICASLKTCLEMYAAEPSQDKAVSAFLQLRAKWRKEPLDLSNVF